MIEENELIEWPIKWMAGYSPQPGDILVVKPADNRRMSNEAVKQIGELLKGYLPESVKIWVLADRLDFEVIRPGETKCDQDH